MDYSKFHISIFSLAFFLIISFTHLESSPQGGAMSIEAVRGVKFKERVLIGSRPPRCERRCSSCVECVAIQVPIGPQKRNLMRPIRTLNSRGDSLSNYKPISWKCKCGNFIFNP